eukprot:g78970.t1
MASLHEPLLPGEGGGLAGVRLYNLPKLVGLLGLSVGGGALVSLGRLFAATTSANAPKPKEGSIDSVLVTPGSPGPVQLLAAGPEPANGVNVPCIFEYGALQDTVKVTGAKKQDGWVYGARLSGKDSAWAVRTGEKDDVLEGRLFCWPADKMKAADLYDRLHTRDQVRDYDPAHPTEGYQRRGTVSVVTKDGKVNEAFWYYAAPASGSFFELSAVDIDGGMRSFEQYLGQVIMVINVGSK